MDLDLITHGRRFHYGLRRLIEDFDGRGEEQQWQQVERPVFEHHACSMYLIGVLAVLEGRFGVRCWNNPGTNHSNLTDYIEDPGTSQELKDLELSADKMNALAEIRNALVHNAGKLSENHNSNAVQMVEDANITGVLVEGVDSEITLVSNESVDFLNYVRLCYICVVRYLT